MSLKTVLGALTHYPGIKQMKDFLKKILFNPFRIPGAEYSTFLWLDKIKPAISLHVFIVYGSFLLFAAHFEYYNPDRLTFLLQKLLLFPGIINEIGVHVFTTTDGGISHSARQYFKQISSQLKKKICRYIFMYVFACVYACYFFTNSF